MVAVIALYVAGFASDIEKGRLRKRRIRDNESFTDTLVIVLFISQQYRGTSQRDGIESNTYIVLGVVDLLEFSIGALKGVVEEGAVLEGLLLGTARPSSSSDEFSTKVQLKTDDLVLARFKAPPNRAVLPLKVELEKLSIPNKLLAAPPCNDAELSTNSHWSNVIPLPPVPELVMDAPPPYKATPVNAGPISTSATYTPPPDELAKFPENVTLCCAKLADTTPAIRNPPPSLPQLFPVNSAMLVMSRDEGNVSSSYSSATGKLRPH